MRICPCIAKKKTVLLAKSQRNWGFSREETAFRQPVLAAGARTVRLILPVYAGGDLSTRRRV